MLGVEPTKAFGVLDRGAARQRVVELSERYGLAVDPDAIVEELPVGIQQRVEIIKALVRDARCLILDEPTAVLTPPEIEELLDIVRQLCGRRPGHRVHHPQAPRGPRGGRPDQRPAPGEDGRVPPTPSDTTPAELASLMVGHDVKLAGRQGRVRPRRRGARRSTTSPCSTTAGTRWSTASTSRSEPARSSPWPASTATARPSWCRRSPGIRRPDGGHGAARRRTTSPAPARSACSTSASATSPRTASATASSGPSRVADNLVLNRWRSKPFAKGFRGIRIDRGAVRAHAERADRGLRHPDHGRRRRRSRRSRAATSRR